MMKGKRGQNKSLQDKEECAGREEQVELSHRDTEDIVCSYCTVWPSTPT